MSQGLRALEIAKRVLSRNMRAAALLVFMVVLVHDGGRCLGYVVENRLRMPDPSPSHNVNKNDGKLYHVKHEDDSLTPNADQAKHLVNDFLQKLKRNENVESAPTADKCGYEVCIINVNNIFYVFYYLKNAFFSIFYFLVAIFFILLNLLDSYIGLK